MLLVKISVGNIIRRHGLKNWPPYDQALCKKVQVFYKLAPNFTNLVILFTQCSACKVNYFRILFLKCFSYESHFHRANFLQEVTFRIESLS